MTLSPRCASIAYNDYLGRWTAVYAEDLSDHAVMPTAPDLTGPWSTPARLFTADRKATAGWTYDATRTPSTPAMAGACSS